MTDPALTISLTHSRARGADDGGRRRRDASYGVARDSHTVSTISTCGVPDRRQQLVRRCVWQWTVADVDGLLVPRDRRRFGAAPAMMVPRRSGATNTTLAATQRHPCRCGMVTADCARSRSRPETVVASGGAEGSAENSRVHHLSHPLASARR